MTLRMATVRASRVSESVEQQHIVQLARSVGGRVWVLGTKRKRGDFQGTCQTPGISDLVLFLPKRVAGVDIHGWSGRELVFVEVKAAGGKLRPEQIVFREECLAAGAAHVVGGLNAFIEFLIARGLVKAENVPTYRRPEVP